MLFFVRQVPLVGIFSFLLGCPIIGANMILAKKFNPVVYSKFEPSNFSPWEAEIDVNKLVEIFDEEDSEEDYSDDFDVPDTKVKRAQTGLCRKPNGRMTNFTAPSFKKSPEERQNIEAGFIGHRMELKCPHMKGCPRSSITWWKDGKEVLARPQSGGLSGIFIRKKGDLTIENNMSDDDGLYTCIITNTEGSISHQIEVRSVARTVGSPPKVYPGQPGNHTVLVGSNLTLLCQLVVTDQTNPHQIRWFKHYTVNGSWTDESGHVYAVKVQDSISELPPVDSQKLELVNMTSSDTGWVSCLVNNQYGNLTRSGWVEVVTTLGDEEVEVSYIPYLVFSVVGLVLLGLLSVYCAKYRKERKDKLEAVEAARCVARWTKKVIVEHNQDSEGLSPLVRVERVMTEESGPVEDNLDMEGEVYEFSLDPMWEFPRELLTMQGELGQGQFGRVMLGLAHGCRSGEKGQLVAVTDVEDPLVVAVKMVKEGATEEEMLDLVKEIEVMKVVGRHVNIVSLLGVCTQPSGQPLLAILEYAEQGNLRDFLWDRRGGEMEQVSFRQMVSFAWQVGQGMEYLAARRCVHRDLAARNILVSGDVVKVADFGLARDLEGGDYYRKLGDAKLPVFWMSPESLFESISTTSSDVWSFGVLMWEIVTWGERPYKGVAVEVLFDLIKEGYRMGRPPHCPGEFYRIMRLCWAYEPSERPSWTCLVTSLHSLHHFTLPGVYLNLARAEVNTPNSSPGSIRGASSRVSVPPHNESPVYSTTESPPIVPKEKPVPPPKVSSLYPQHQVAPLPQIEFIPRPQHVCCPLTTDSTEPPPQQVTAHRFQHEPVLSDNQVVDLLRTTGRRISEESGYDSSPSPPISEGGYRTRPYYNLPHQTPVSYLSMPVNVDCETTDELRIVSVTTSDF